MLFVFDVNKELMLLLTPTLLVIKILTRQKKQCENLEEKDCSGFPFKS